MAKSSSTTAASVPEYIKALDKPLAEIVEAIRKVILSTDKTISEQIKWNSPSYFYNGEMKPFDPKEYKRDLIVINSHRGYILLVFPTGEKVKDVSEYLEGKYTDGRRLMKIMDLNDLKLKEKDLKKVIKEWLKLVE